MKWNQKGWQKLDVGTKMLVTLWILCGGTLNVLAAEQHTRVTTQQYGCPKARDLIASTVAKLWKRQLEQKQQSSFLCGGGAFGAEG